MPNGHGLSQLARQRLSVFGRQPELTGPSGVGFEAQPLGGLAQLLSVLSPEAADELQLFLDRQRQQAAESPVARLLGALGGAGGLEAVGPAAGPSRAAGRAIQSIEASPEGATKFVGHLLGLIKKPSVDTAIQPAEAAGIDFAKLEGLQQRRRAMQSLQQQFDEMFAGVRQRQESARQLRSPETPGLEPLGVQDVTDLRTLRQQGVDKARLTDTPAGLLERGQEQLIQQLRADDLITDVQVQLLRESPHFGTLPFEQVLQNLRTLLGA